MANNKFQFPADIADGAFPLVARLLICGIFAQGALGKIMGWQGQAQYMASRGMQPTTIPALLGIALVIEAVGVLCLVVGWQARVAAFIMFLYLGAVSVMLHNFWTLTGMSAGVMQTQFMKNVAIMGGLLMISAYGAGRWSVDGKSSG